MEPQRITAEPGAPTVYTARHAAEALTGCRVPVEAEVPTAHMPLPWAEDPSLGHFAMLIDVAAGQATERHLAQTGDAVRTVSLHIHLAGALSPGQWVTGIGRVISSGPQDILAGCEVYSSRGSLVAVGTCRFMRVGGEAAGGAGGLSQTLARAAVPQTWTPAFGLSAPTEDQGGLVHRAAPDIRTGNGAGVMQGGLQTRMLEVAMRHLLGAADDGALCDLSMFFHRPVPLVADPSDQDRAAAGAGRVGDQAGAAADGATLETRTRRRGRRVTFALAELRSETGSVLANAEATFLAPSG